MVVKQQKETKRFSIFNGDCCEVLPDLPDESVGFSVFSPPFADLYSYSDDERDMSNGSYKEFFNHFEFLVNQLKRLMMPGRVVAVHCMDLPTYKSVGEEIGLRDFPGDIIRCFEKFGFIHHSPRIVIWKDPLLAAVRTKAIGLAHKQIIKDSAMCRTAIPDYIVAFRKPGENPNPIRHNNGLTEYHGSREVPRELNRFINWDGEQKANKRSHWIWQQYASPVWFDIRQTKVLQFRAARDGDDEKHICPLQQDVVERCIELWSTKKDVVLTPYMGVGTEVYVAVKNGRKGLGVELKTSYYEQALKNLHQLKRDMQASKGLGIV